ncbi:MAG TPA: hypothetical protein VGQ73_04425 [Gemmatimonadales bacterium]|jgi:hypothetical protein|nr:hypothetical protein [Gemmatimonadales bacterium]
MALNDGCRRWARGGITAMLAALTLDCGRQERVDPTAAPIAEFNQRVDAYVALRNKLADAVGPLDETKSQAEIAARATALANSIIAARPDAKQGDIFTTEVAAVLATLLKEEFRRRADSIKETRVEQEQEHRTDGLPDFVPKVNQIYPTTYPLVTFPPTLLPLLPKLPEQLEYRLMGHHLFLRDVEANLIVDVMPNAVP